MQKLIPVLAGLLILGIVDRIEGDVATIEYVEKGRILHTDVSLSLSPCVPSEGQSVYFYKNYKIVTCEDVR